MDNFSSPVVTIDGPSGVGKGSVSLLLANELHWHFLDSGSLYRLVALDAQKQHLAFTDPPALAALARCMEVTFEIHEGREPQIVLSGEVVTDAIRTPECGQLASQLAAYPEVRAGLLERQRQFRQLPGLVADGRDMGTVVFPDATVKFFLTASAAERANRRYNQLKQKGIDVNLAGLLADIEERDKRDRERTVSPLHPASDAILIDTTTLSLEQVYQQVLQQVRERISE